MRGGQRRVKRAAWRETDVCGCLGDGEILPECATVQYVLIQRNDGVEGAQHGESKNSIDGEVDAESERNSGRGASDVQIWRVASNNRGEVAVVAIVKVGRIADGAAEFHRFERVSGVKSEVLGNKERLL